MALLTFAAAGRTRFRQAKCVWILAGLAAGVVLASPGAAPANAASSPTYMTLQLAHSEEGLVDRSCHPLAGVMTLEQQAAAYKAMGISAVTSTAIVDWMGQSAPHCQGADEIASWQEAVSLQKNDGWTFVSGSVHGDDLLLLTPAAAQAEICDSGEIIGQEGLSGQWGEFAFPYDKTDSQLEQTALSCGYAFGRLYATGSNALPIQRPYWLSTMSLNGGACADVTRSCYRLATRYHYTDPAALVSIGRLSPGYWKVLQGYVLVTGTIQSDLSAWDCTSPDWHEHWSSGPVATEIYCWNDWEAALAAWHGLEYVTPDKMRLLRQP